MLALQAFSHPYRLSRLRLIACKSPFIPGVDQLLKQRVITAAILLIIYVPALFAQSSWPFLLLTLFMTTLAAWEWARMNPLPFLKAYPYAALVLGLCALDWWFSWSESLAPWGGLTLGLVWFVFFAMVLRWGVKGWQDLAFVLRACMGLAMLLGAWVSFGSAKALSTHFLMSVLVLVWTSDVGAYFVGKAMGRTKLAPVLSPGKSREGALGGMVLVFVLGLAWLHLEDLFQLESMSIFTLLWQRGWAYFVFGLVALVSCSVLGDLFESMVKRAMGFKDSSHLLPGHGGVLDRIDALLPTVPLAVFLAHWVS